MGSRPSRPEAASPAPCAARAAWGVGAGRPAGRLERPAESVRRGQAALPVFVLLAAKGHTKVTLTGSLEAPNSSRAAALPLRGPAVMAGTKRNGKKARRGAVGAGGGGGGGVGAVGAGALLMRLGVTYMVSCRKEASNRGVLDAGSPPAPPVRAPAARSARWCN